MTKDLKKALKILKNVRKDVKKTIANESNEFIKEYYELVLQLVEEVETKFLLGGMSWDEVEEEISFILDPEALVMCRELFEEDYYRWKEEEKQRDEQES